MPLVTLFEDDMLPFLLKLSLYSLKEVNYFKWNKLTIQNKLVFTTEDIKNS
jgi:hypothetical protein